mmetsp:Transcript_21372/g.62326  ORF Transcript_21372/g.62326 Transcript_21372/m.62326 type:complete len:231 (+) Transcript_21372:2308-3000(+)
MVPMTPCSPIFRRRACRPLRGSSSPTPNLREPKPWSTHFHNSAPGPEVSVPNVPYEFAHSPPRRQWNRRDIMPPIIVSIDIEHVRTDERTTSVPSQRPRVRVGRMPRVPHRGIPPACLMPPYNSSIDRGTIASTVPPTAGLRGVFGLLPRDDGGRIPITIRRRRRRRPRPNWMRRRNPEGRRDPKSRHQGHRRCRTQCTRSRFVWPHFDRPLRSAIDGANPPSPRRPWPR